MKKKQTLKKRSLQVGALLILAVIVIFFQVRGSSSKTTGTSANVVTQDESGTVCPQTNGSSPRITHFKKAPVMCINTASNYSASVKTTAGTFVISLDAKQYPVTTNNFVFLSRYHFYNGLDFFRVIPGFVIQGGDPLNNGTGGPGYSFGGEYPKAGQYKLGTIAMANTGQPNSNGSQFFITEQAYPSLDQHYTIFGQCDPDGVVVVKAIARVNRDGNDKPITPVVLNKVVIVPEGEPVPPLPAEPQAPATGAAPAAGVAPATGTQQ